MTGYDQQLRRLQEQCARKKKLEATAAELQGQQEAYAARVRELEQAFQEEQADVDRLEGRSLSALLYNALGKMDEKLTREKQEAYAARLKYDTAARELAAIQGELRRCQGELASLGDCEGCYRALFQEKTQAVKEAGGAAAEELLRLEEQAAYLDSQQGELDEALAAGETALATADRIVNSLHSAESWGTWDLFGGGFLAGLAKHSRLDDAQASLESLQSQLRQFKTQLADVTIDAQFQVSIDGFLRLADYVFDGIFADWAVLDRIRHSQDQMERTRDQIRSLLDHLRTLGEKTAAQKGDIQRQLEKLVEQVPM